MLAQEAFLLTQVFFRLECVQAAAESSKMDAALAGPEYGYYNAAIYETQKGECHLGHWRSEDWHGRELSSVMRFGTKVSHTTGSEGPKHDPYHYDEITVETGGVRITLHSGLMVWLDIETPIEKVRQDLFGSDYDNGDHIFECLTGYHPSQWLKWHEDARSRCRQCGNHKKFRYGRGYVGETVTICGVCGNVICDDFHISMIE